MEIVTSQMKIMFQRMSQEGWVSQMGRGVKFRKRGWVEFRKRGQVKFRKREWVKFRKRAGEIQKEGVGEIQKEGEGSGMGKGMRGKGKGMSGMGIGAVGMGCKRQPKEIEHRYRKCKNIVREHPATPLPLRKHHVQKDPCKNVVPTLPGVHIKKKMLHKNNHHAEEMAECINIRDAVGTNIGCYYKCKECAFECATRADRPMRILWELLCTLCRYDETPCK